MEASSAVAKIFFARANFSKSSTSIGLESWSWTIGAEVFFATKTDVSIGSVWAIIKVALGSIFLPSASGFSIFFGVAVLVGNVLLRAFFVWVWALPCGTGVIVFMLLWSCTVKLFFVAIGAEVCGILTNANIARCTKMEPVKNTSRQIVSRADIVNKGLTASSDTLYSLPNSGDLQRLNGKLV